MTSKVVVCGLSGVCETLLIPLYYRALESRCPEPLIRDPKAAALVDRIDYDFSKFESTAAERVFAMMRARHFDQAVRTFLLKHPDGSVVDIGCGLDTRFERVDNGTMKWYGLDLPEVIELRRRLIDETARSHFVAKSALDFSWMKQVYAGNSAAYLFLGEGVFTYLEPDALKNLVIALADTFRGSGLVVDGMSPFFVWVHNRRGLLKRVNTRLLWGLKHPREAEAWSNGICLSSVWTYFDDAEPRLGRYSLLRYIPAIRKASWVAHYRFLAD